MFYDRITNHESIMTQTKDACVKGCWKISLQGYLLIEASSRKAGLFGNVIPICVILQY